jgi:hypothetical protein
MSGQFLPVEGEESALREGFHRLANARENPEALAKAQEWVLELLADAPLVSARELDLCPALPADDGTVWRSGPGHTPPPEADKADLIAFHAPLALLEGAWLQSLAMANGHRQPINSLFACYLALLGEDESDSPAVAYRGWLNRCQISLPEASSWRFAQHPRIGASALHFAGLQLALGLHAARFFPEALGFTLAYVQSASPWRLPALRPAKRNAVLAAMARHAADALQAFTSARNEGSRVRKGFALYRKHESAYLDDLQTFADKPMSPAEKVASLFRRKLGFTRGCHAGVDVGGRGLEDWFAETPFDATGFLDAFASSNYAKGEKGGRLFDRINQFGGPMFGVFDKAEMESIDAWLDGVDNSGKTMALDCPSAQNAARADRARKAIPAMARPVDKARARNGSGHWVASHRPIPPLALTFFNHTDHRSLFNLLINQDAQAKTQAAAGQRVEQVLACARSALRRNGPLDTLFLDYSPEGFARRIVQAHEAEMAKFKPFQAPPTLRREEYVWGIRQFAPAILVDGCWLQHMGEAANQGRRTQRLLYRIYAEELGGGKLDWNHPKIYRDLLEALGIDLPAAETWGFARHRGFLDAAFDLPSYLLAISQFPKTYFPELLGLNLAIELSGLGGGYRRLAEELRYWDINPLIVTLHQSIDNLAGGHAAMACEAVQSYMGEISCLGGIALMEENWRRIGSGYLSLHTVTRRLKWALALAFCRKFVPRRLFQFLLNL